MAGDIVRGVGSEKHCSSFQVMFIAKTPQRNVREKKLLKMLQDAIRHVGGEPARSNCIYLNVVARPLAGQVFGKTDDSTLAGVIANGRKFRRSPAQSGDRRNVYDLPCGVRGRAVLVPALTDHDFAYRLGAQKSAGQVGLDDFVPVLKPHLFYGSAPGYSRIINEDIDSSEMGEGRIYHLLNAGWVLNVAAKGDGFDAKLLQFLGNLMAALFLAGAQHQIGSHFRQTLRHLAAQADGTSGNDRNPSG